jgi:hypothetical protein
MKAKMLTAILIALVLSCCVEDKKQIVEAPPPFKPTLERVITELIEQFGGTVRGWKGTEIGLPSGDKIPPTKIEIIRP